MFNNKVGRTLSTQESIKIFLHQKSDLTSSAPVLWFPSMFFIAQVGMFVDLNPIELYMRERKLAGSHYSQLSPRLQKNNRYLLGNPQGGTGHQDSAPPNISKSAGTNQGGPGPDFTTRGHTKQSGTETTRSWRLWETAMKGGAKLLNPEILFIYAGFPF